MMKKKSTMKRMLLTGAALTVTLLGFAAAPAMAFPPPGQISDPPTNVSLPDPPVPYCAKHPEICGCPDQPPTNVAPPDDPPANPPPANPDPPGSTDEGKSSNADSAVGGSYDTESGSGIFDRGGVFISDLLPDTFTSTLSDTGNSVKENLPASVARNLPDTVGGWSFLLLLAAGALIAGGFILRSIVRRRTTSVTHSAH